MSVKSKGKSRTKEARDSSPAAPSTSSTSGKSRPTSDTAEGPVQKSSATERPPLRLTEGVSRDVSMLRQPIDVGTAGAIQVTQCIQYGTQEVHDMLVYECDLIFECKVCRSMFRGLPNFMAHKRVYCTTQYQEKDMQYVIPTLNEPETIVIQPEAPPEIPEVKIESEEATEASETTAEVETVAFPVMEKMLQKQTELDFYNKAIERERLKKETKEMAAVRLTPIQGNPNAVFQSFADFGGGGIHSSETAVVEVEPCMNGRPVRQPKPNKKFDDYEMEEIEEGGERITVVRPEAPKGFRAHISPHGSDSSENSGEGKPLTLVEKLKMRDDCNIKEIKCLLCQSTFTTVKSLGRHMTALHSNKRVYFPCLFCPGIFSQTSSAVRHIVRAHNKSTEEAEGLRAQIREHSFVKQVEEFDIGDEMKTTSVRTWMMKKDPEIDPDTELRTTVSTENIINTPRPKSSFGKYLGLGLSGSTSNPGRFRCPCGKFFSSSWNFTQHAMACKVAKAKKVKIPPPVKIKSDTGSPVKTDAPSNVAEGTSQGNVVASPKKDKEGASPAAAKMGSPGIGQPGSPVKRYRCHLCKKMYSSSWNYAQHIKACGTRRRKAILSASHNSSKGDGAGSPGKNTSTSSPNKSNVPKSPSKSTGSPTKTTSGGSTCKTNEIQSASSDSDDSKSSDEEEVVIKPRFVAEKEQAKQVTSSGGSSSKNHRSKSPSSGGGGGKERKNGDDGAASPDESPPGSPPKLSDTELRRIRQIVREDELRCLKCHKQYSTVSYLHRHAVRHLGWRRFKCKLCKFTAYNRSECTTHLRKVHRAKTMGVRDMNPFIHDLEPEKMKQEPTVLTRVERTVHCHNDSLHSVSQPPASVAATTANNACTNAADNYNISTRRNRRVFDTKPYTREEQEEDDKSDSETKDDDDDVDDESGALTTLRTRGGAYTKPDLLKRKRDESDDDDEEKSAKRKRTHSGLNGNSDDASRTSSEDSEVQFRAETEFKVKSENEESDQETEMLSNGQHKAEKRRGGNDARDGDSRSGAGKDIKAASGLKSPPTRSRKSDRPQKSVLHVTSENERRSRSPGSVSASQEKRWSSPGRSTPGAAKLSTSGGGNVQTPVSSALASGVGTKAFPSSAKNSTAGAKLVRQGSGNSSGTAVKMSQKIQDLVQSDVDSILQMVQGNKVQSVPQNSVGPSGRKDEVVILVVGENKSLSPMKAMNSATAAGGPIKISLAPKVLTTGGGAAVFATANSTAAAAALGTRGLVTVSRSPVKILPKPVPNAVNSNAGTKISIFDKLAAKQLNQGQKAVSVASVPAPVASVTAGNRSPRRQQSAQK